MNRVFSLFVIILGFSAFSYSAEVDDLLRPLIDAQKINPAEDEIVLLSTSSGMADFLNLSNVPSEGFKIGKCLGMTQMQMALFSGLRFDSSKPKDSDDEIYQKLKKALESDQKENLIINGFHDRADFIATRSKVLEKAIEEFQANNQVAVSSSGSTTIAPSASRGVNDKSVPGLKTKIENASILSQQLQSRIQNKLPTQLVVFRSSQNQTTGAPGHAVIVLGYAKKKGSETPDRFLVVDPNFPREIRVLERKGNAWEFDLPSPGGAKIQATEVVASSITSENSKIRDRRMSGVFHQESLTSHSLRSCGRASVLPEIFNPTRH